MRIGLLRSVLLGAAYMYFFDARMGRRRRANVIGQFIHYRKQARKLTAGRSIDLWNRTRGIAFQALGRLRKEQPAARTVTRRPARPAKSRASASNGDSEA